MNWVMQAACVATGAVLGAWVRWQMGVWLNGSSSLLLLGTLVVNCAGCFLAGLWLNNGWHGSWQLLWLTGFLGCLTTFSAFASEVANVWLHDKWLNALLIWAAHNVGGLLSIAAGVYLARLLGRG